MDRLDRLAFRFGGLTFPVYLIINNGSFVPHIKSWESRDFAKFPVILHA